VIETLSPNPRDSQSPPPREGVVPPDPAGEPIPEKRGVGYAPFAAMAAVLAALMWAYWPNIRYLVGVWNHDPNYSHGYLVIPVALLILWRRWTDGTPPEPRQSLWGWVALVLALASRALFYERGSDWTETATLLPVVACLTWAAGGWPLLRTAWPAIAFLVFLFPLPLAINSILAQPLQRVATMGTMVMLKLSGLWALAEGNVIVVGSDTLEVAAACNGLSMLMCLAATVAAMTLLIKMEIWKQLVLLASIVPIALASNILRITATAWCYHLFGAEVGGHFAHDAAGWLMMPTALVLVGLELAILSRLIIAEEEIPVERADRLRTSRTVY